MHDAHREGQDACRGAIRCRRARNPGRTGDDAPVARYNAALEMAPSERRKLLMERFAAVGDGAVIRPPFHCDYGLNIRLGAGVFLNPAVRFHR